MNQRVLVTGATGNAGKEVLSALKTNHPETIIRIATRNTGRTKTAAGNLESVYLDFTNTDTFATAVANCTSLFLLRPPAISNTKETLNPFIDAARRAGIRRIVFLSVAGAADNRMVPHHAVEQHLRDGVKDWTILRTGFFAQNLATAYRSEIIEKDRIYVPAKKGKVAFIDLRDLGKVAADMLTMVSQHSGKIYTLTGPKSYSFYQIAHILSKYLNRNIEYVPATVTGYFHHLLVEKDLAFMQSLVQTILHVGLRYGQAEKVDPALEKLLDQYPNTVETYIKDHLEIWEK